MNSKASAIIDEMKSIGEDILFTNGERNRLQKVFTQGTLSKTICWIGWVEYKDHDGKTHYTGNFSDEVMDLMVEICTERINAAKQRLDEMYKDFSLQKCADFINKQISVLKKVEYNSTEWERIKNNAIGCKADVENGKLNLEGNRPSYDCIVIRQESWYIGSIIVKKAEYGYTAECRCPLAGMSRCFVAKDELFKYLKEKIVYILS